MKYYNEATVELINTKKDRIGVIPVKKELSSTKICQGDFTSSKGLTIFDKSIKIKGTVVINNIGTIEALKHSGFPIEEVEKKPSLYIPDIIGLKIPNIKKVAISYKKSIPILNKSINIVMEEDCFAYYTSFSIKESGVYDIIKLKETDFGRLIISGMYLKCDNNVLVELEKNKRYLLTTFWIKDDNNNALIGVVVLGDTIISVISTKDNINSPFEISTYGNGLITYSSESINFPKKESLTTSFTNATNVWSNNIKDFNVIYRQLNTVLNKVYDIIEDTRRSC